MKVVVVVSVVGAMLAGYVGSVAAEEICTAQGWRMPVSEKQERSYILNGVGVSDRVPRIHRRHQGPRLKNILDTLDFGDLWPDEFGARISCRGYSERILLDRARQLGPNHPYLRALAENQLVVLRNCRTRLVKPEFVSKNWYHIPDTDGQLDKIAHQDFYYLSATTNYYAKDVEAALEAYGAAAKDAESPHRDAARLMQVRLLRMMKKPHMAQGLVGRYRSEANDQFKEWLDQQEDLIARNADVPELRIVHLEKVFKRVYGLPIVGEPEGFRRDQAVYDFERYFIYERSRLRKYKKEGQPHDWWLRPEVPVGSTAFAAVHALSKKYDKIDWTAARHASQAYERDNTWFVGPDLDVDDPAYGSVTDHAYRRWKESGVDRWAVIVAARIDATSPYAGDVLGFVRQMQVRAQTCSLSLSEYVLYQAVFRHAVRIVSSAGDYEEAFLLLKTEHENKLYAHQVYDRSAGRAFAKLLMIRGEFGLLERYQAEITIDPRIRLWLAKTTEELVAFDQGNLAEFANMLDADAIWKLLSLKNDRGRSLLPRQYQTDFARVLWMRGYVFQNEKAMDRAQPLLVKFYPSLHPYFRHADKTDSAKERRRIFTHMILKNPGLSPFAFEGVRKRRKDLTIILAHDQIEGNWWCTGEDRALVQDDEEALSEAFFTRHFQSPSPNRYDRRPNRGWRLAGASQVETEMIAQAWVRFREQYVPFQMLSSQAQARLANLPRGSAYLGAEVQQWKNSPSGVADWILQRDDRIPESLHRVVFSTRNSCNNLKKGNKDVSLAAFRALHRRYGNSPWAARTPYWFDRGMYRER